MKDSTALRSTGVLLAQVVFVWGAWVVCPRTHVFDLSPVYTEFARYGSSTFWGGSAMVVGSLQMWAAIKRHAAAAFVSSLLLAAWFAFGAWCFAVADHHSPAAAIYVVMLCWQIAVCVDAGRRTPNTIVAARSLVSLRWRPRHGS